LYPDPEQFLPDRFLKQEGKQQQPDPVLSGAFGYGRRYVYTFLLTAATTVATNDARICPGRHLTIQAAWLAISYILTLYTISPATDENGMKIELKRENTSGISVYVFYSIRPMSISIFALHLSGTQSRSEYN
jgi:cytochrome P450